MKTKTIILSVAFALSGILVTTPSPSAAANSEKGANSAACYRMQAVAMPDVISTRQVKIIGVSMKGDGSLSRHHLKSDIRKRLPDNFSPQDQKSFFDALTPSDFEVHDKLPWTARTPLDVLSSEDSLIYYVLLPKSWTYNTVPMTFKKDDQPRRWRHAYARMAGQAVNSKTAYMYHQAIQNTKGPKCRYEYNLHVSIIQPGRVKGKKGYEDAIMRTDIIIDPGSNNDDQDPP